jgi:hypothetical protein
MLQKREQAPKCGSNEEKKYIITLNEAEIPLPFSQEPVTGP